MKKIIMFLVGVFATAGLTRADLLLSWDGGGFLGNEAQFTNNFAAANLTLLAPITRSTGLTASAGAGGFNSSGFTIGGSEAAAVANTDYYELTISASSGYQLSITNYSFRTQRSAAGPTNVFMRSSADSYASTLAAMTFMSPGAAEQTNVIWAISGINDQQSVTLRIYGYNAGTAGGTFRAANAGGTFAGSNEVVLYGTVVAVPEPSTMAFLMLGLGGLVYARRRRNT